MGRFKAWALGAVAGCGALSLAAGSQAAISVYGGGAGETCWRAAVASNVMHMNSAADEGRWKANAIAQCDEAILNAPLSIHDLAATQLNRGILEMSRLAYHQAEDNFRKALRLMPKLAEAHVNLGSAMIGLHQLDEGIAETKLGIDLGVMDKARAYYNLGLAYDEQGKLQQAYDSYKQAALAQPDWKEPKDQLARFVTKTVEVQK